jgi:hypothetical protein
VAKMLGSALSSIQFINNLNIQRLRMQASISLDGINISHVLRRPSHVNRCAEALRIWQASGTLRNIEQYTACAAIVLIFVYIYALICIYI